MKLTREAIIHLTFRIGITLKGLDGILETVGGLLLWFMKPPALSELAHVFFLHELSRDPHDFIAAHLLHVSDKLAAADPLFACVYLLAHGVVKIVLVIALWFDKLWAYPATIGIFGAFTAYEFYRFIHRHSHVLGVLSLLDAIVVLLTWHEYRKQRTNIPKTREGNRVSVG